MLKANENRQRSVHGHYYRSLETGLVDSIDGPTKAEIRDDVHGHATVSPRQIRDFAPLGELIESTT